MTSYDPIRDLRSYAAHLQAEVPGELTRLRVARAIASTETAPRRRAKVAVLAAVLIGISNVALARVSDSSIPGDMLYGVDRAYERLSDIFGENDRSSERIGEAGSLASQGRALDALATLRETLTVGEGAAEVAKAQELVAGLDDGPGTEALHQAVSDLVAAAKSVHDAEDHQAAATEISDRANDVSAAATKLKEQAPSGKPDDPGSKGQRP